MRFVTVKTNKGEVRAEVIRENKLTLVVQLPDGDIIKRHKKKHLVHEQT